MNALLNANQTRSVGMATAMFPAFPATSVWANATVASRPAKRVRLNAGQLLDVELGLYLLSQLMPTASPYALPVLLNEQTQDTVPTAVTPRQRKLLSRGRAILSHLYKQEVWSALLDAYTTVPDRLQAYDISLDRSRFAQKSVGFFRNRILMLKKVVG